MSGSSSGRLRAVRGRPHRPRPCSVTGGARGPDGPRMRGAARPRFGEVLGTCTLPVSGLPVYQPEGCCARLLVRAPSSPGRGPHSPTQPTDDRDAQRAIGAAGRCRRSYRPPTLTINPRSSSWINVVTASGIDIPASRATASGQGRRDRAFHTLRSPSSRSGRRRRRRRAIDAEVVAGGRSAPRISVAPSRIISSGVSASGLVTGPGTAKTSRPELERVVDGDPRAALRRALYHHQRAGRAPRRSGSVRGSAAAPPEYVGRVLARRSCRSPRSVRAVLGCSPGRRRRCPSRAPRRCVPPPGAHPRCAAASIPCAAPETTASPARDERSPRSCATSRPSVRTLPRAHDRDTLGRVTERPPEEEEARRRIRQVVQAGRRTRDPPARRTVAPALFDPSGGDLGVDLRQPLAVPVASQPASPNGLEATGRRALLPRFRVHSERT